MMRQEKKWFLRILSLVLAFAMIVLMNGTFADDSVILKIGFITEIEEAELASVEGGDLVVDLYKIADIEWDGSIGRYLFSSDINGIVDIFASSEAFQQKENTDSYYVKMSYSDGDDNGKLADALSEIADEAADVLFRGSADPETPQMVPVNSTSEESSTAERGLYLGVVRPEGKSDQVDYLDTDGDTVRSFANSATMVYTFDPILIPMTNTDFEEINLKYASDVRLGDLKIVKELLTFVEGSPVTFVFYIHAELDGQQVYDDYESLTFAGADTNSVTILGKIPMGASVTVEESYEGTTYQLVDTEYSSGEDDFVIVPPDEDGNIATVTFTNDFRESNIKGYGVRNEYTVVEEQYTKSLSKNLRFNGNDLGWGGDGIA